MTLARNILNQFLLLENNINVKCSVVNEKTLSFKCSPTSYFDQLYTEVRGYFLSGGCFFLGVKCKIERNPGSVIVKFKSIDFNHHLMIDDVAKHSEEIITNRIQTWFEG